MNQTKEPTIMTPRASRISAQLRMTKPMVTWFRWMMAPTDMANVMRNAIPRIIPAVRSFLLKTMFVSRLGARQTTDNATETAPAASKQKSRNTQTPINRLDTMMACQWANCTEQQWKCKVVRSQLEGLKCGKSDSRREIVQRRL